MFDNYDEVSLSEDKDLVVFNEKKCGSISEKIVKYKLNIISMTVEPYQIPTQENGYTAIIKGGLHMDTGKFEAVDTATPESINGSKDIERLIDKATVNAFSKAATCAISISQTKINNSNSFQTNSEKQINSGHHQYKLLNNQRQSGHNPNKPASDGQIKFIRKLCNQHGISDIEARKKAGIYTIDVLSSKDANAIIQALK